ALDVSLKEDGLFKDGIMPDEPTKNTIALGRESLKITAEFQPSQLFDNSFAQAAAKELDAKGWKP
ncbi:MAG: hypothetical protein Q8P59_01285, partial [Dehalococcoidia bacterium]|nr:hypothetical protein [Dehalococcoidia bacterium]